MEQSLLLTGASGFLGSNILPILRETYRLDTCGRSPVNDLQVDLSTHIPTFHKAYDVVVHAAGLAHTSCATSQQFMDVNHVATRNLCQGLESSGAVPHTLIYISTVAVYGCSAGEEIAENHPLLGSSPYAISKICAEEFLRAWAERVGCHLVVLRPALIAGANPPGNLGAMIRAIRSGRYVSIGKARARKSMVLASDIARLITMLEGHDGTFNVCADYHPTFSEIEQRIARLLSRPAPRSIPRWLAVAVAKVGDILGVRAPLTTPRLQKITSTLTFSNAAIKNATGFTFTPVLPNFHRPSSGKSDNPVASLFSSVITKPLLFCEK